MEPLYAVDDEEPCTLAEFLAVNEDLDPVDVCAIEALGPDESLVLGGGAAAEATITRVARSPRPSIEALPYAVPCTDHEVQELRAADDLTRARLCVAKARSWAADAARVAEIDGVRQYAPFYSDIAGARWVMAVISLLGHRGPWGRPVRARGSDG